jgi:hypothetical protein
MNRNRCERGPELILATRRNAVPAELESHAAFCSSCTETRRILTLMLHHAASVEATVAAESHPLPTADRIWRRARSQKRELAFTRATRALVLMQSLGALYVAILAIWATHAVWLSQRSSVATAWSSVATTSILGVTVLAIVLTALGAASLLLVGKHSLRDATSS